MTNATAARTIDSKMIIGGFLMLLGFVLLLDRFDVIYIGSIWKYWPFIFTLVGIVKLANTFNAREFGEGLWWIFLGLWLYVSIEHVFDLSFSDTWPALLIAWGVRIIWKSFFSHSCRFVKE